MSCPAPGSATVCSLGAASPGAEMGASRCDKGVRILILLSLGVISTLLSCLLCKYWRKSGLSMELDTFLKKGLFGHLPVLLTHNGVVEEPSIELWANRGSIAWLKDNKKGSSGTPHFL